MELSRQNLIKGGVGIIVILALLWLIWYIFSPSSKPFQMGPIAVYATKAKSAEWRSEIDTTGTISAFQGIMLKPEVAGRITKLSFKSGEMIEKGQPILQIYPDILEAELTKAKSALSLAKTEYDRGQKLLLKKVMSQQKFDTLNAEFQEAQSTVNQLEAQLRQHNITAPFTGRLGLRRVSLGGYLQPGQPIVNLQQLDPIRVEFSIPEVYLPDLQVGQQVQIISAANPGKVYTGKIYAFDSALDVQTRTIDARAKIPNKELLLVPGTFAKVRIYGDKMRKVIVIPQTALVYDLTGTAVYLIKDKKVKKTSVTIGQRRDKVVEVLSGLKPGDIIVTAGQVKLFDGAPVRIEQPKPKTTSKTPAPTEKK